MVTALAWRDRLSERTFARFSGRMLVAVCAACALAVYWIESIAWPLMGGRDVATYLLYYRDMWSSHPSFPQLMLYRTPLAPLIMGGLMQIGGAELTQAGLSLLFAGSVVAFAVAANLYGRRVATLTAVALLLFPGYAALYHQVSSDCVFAAALALWTLLIARAVANPTIPRYVLLAVGLIALVLARPSSTVLLVFAFLPLVLPGTWRERVARGGAFLVASIVLLAAWSSYNDLRYGEFTVARTSGASVPFWRVFIDDKLVQPDNGPASRELAAAVQRYLLPQPPYRDHHIDVDRFFQTSSDYEWGDLVVMTDRVWGWNSDYAILRRVAFEAIRAHTRLYLTTVGQAVRDELWEPYVNPAPTSARILATARKPLTRAQIAAAQAADPGGILWWIASTPDNRIRAVDGRLVWNTRAGNEHYYGWLKPWVDRMALQLPNHTGSASTANVLNKLTDYFPRMPIWLALGVVGVALRRPRGWQAVTFLCAACLGILLLTMASVPSYPEYGLSLDPIYVLFGLVGILGIREPPHKPLLTAEA